MHGSSNPPQEEIPGAANEPVQSEEPAGSPSTGEPAFLLVGKLHRQHGVKGEMIFGVMTDFPERLHSGVVVYVGEEHRPEKIRSRRPYSTGLLLSFEGYDTPEAAAGLRNQHVYVPASDRPPLPEGEYYYHQLIGLDVFSDDGQRIGKVRQILDTGANEVYVVRPDQGGEILLPAIPDVILEINIDRGEMLVHLLPGLLPD